MGREGPRVLSRCRLEEMERQISYRALWIGGGGVVFMVGMMSLTRAVLTIEKDRQNVEGGTFLYGLKCEHLLSVYQHITSISTKGVFQRSICGYEYFY